MIALYISIDCFSTSGRRLIALTMLKTFPARARAASYSSFSGAGGVIGLDQADVRHRTDRSRRSRQFVRGRRRRPCCPSLWPHPVPRQEASVSGIVWLIYLAIIVAVIAAWWMVFTKAGEAGWKSIIPIYNIIVSLKIVGREWWWVILLIIPIVGFIDLDHRRPRPGQELRSGTGFGIGLAFLTPIFGAHPRLRQRHVPGCCRGAGVDARYGSSRPRVALDSERRCEDGLRPARKPASDHPRRLIVRRSRDPGWGPDWAGEQRRTLRLGVRRGCS